MENVRVITHLPSRKLRYPTLGKGKSSSKGPWDMLVPRRVLNSNEDFWSN